MNMIDRAFSAHEKALGVRSQRMELMSRNIANADTPNFKARDIDFKQALKDTAEGEGSTRWSGEGWSSQLC
jgi:flagellar basal-body rod protein FlgB